MQGSAEGAGPRWRPAHYKQAESVDLRHFKVGPKRRRQDSDDAVEEDGVAMAVDDVVDAEAGPGPSSKRQKADDTTWRPASGKVWKAPRDRASAIMKPSSNKSWNQRMADKAARKQLLELKAEAVDAARAKRKAAAEQRKAAKERKVENRKKSEVVQKVSSATVKKMMKSKKQKRLLRTADTNS